MPNRSHKREKAGEIHEEAGQTKRESPNATHGGWPTSEVALAAELEVVYGVCNDSAVKVAVTAEMGAAAAIEKLSRCRSWVAESPEWF
jgi:hypothetical protein